MMPGSLKLKVQARDVSINCCISAAPDNPKVIPSNESSATSLFYRTLYPEHAKILEEAQAKRAYDELKSYLARKVEEEKLNKLLEDKRSNSPLREKEVLEIIAQAEKTILLRKLEEKKRQVESRSLTENSNVASNFESDSDSDSGSEKVVRTSAKRILPKVFKGENSQPFSPRIITSHLKRTTNADPKQIEAIVEKIEDRISSRYKERVESSVILDLVVNEVYKRNIQVKND